MSFKYQLESSTPYYFEGGTNRIATQKNIPSLKDIALYSLQIDPGCLRELHWHPNAGELNYCLQGHGVIGIFSPAGDHDTFEIQEGCVTFVPKGYYHYICNTGLSRLRILAAFTHENPEYLDLSETLVNVPKEYLAKTFGVSTEMLPNLAPRGDKFLVKIGKATTSDLISATGGSHPGSYMSNIEQTPLYTYEGGTVHTLSSKEIPHLDGITVFSLRAVPHALREPHWHPNAGELNYCVQGTAQIGITSPAGKHEIFEVRPGDVAYIPPGYFHYIASITDEPMYFLIFFSSVKPDHIDISQTFDYFPREIIAASFGMEMHVFDNLPKRGDVLIAARKKFAGV
jgi:oxalate decarboxylase